MIFQWSQRYGIWQLTAWPAITSSVFISNIGTITPSGGQADQNRIQVGVVYEAAVSNANIRIGG